MAPSKMTNNTKLSMAMVQSNQLLTFQPSINLTFACMNPPVATEVPRVFLVLLRDKEWPIPPPQLTWPRPKDRLVLNDFID